MRIRIVQIADRGVPNKERLHLAVLRECLLNNYVVFVTSWISPSLIASHPRQIFWFPSHPVKAGDQVVLYTGPGNPVTERTPDGTTVHFLHWGLTQTVWNRPEDCAVLLELSEWQTTPPDSRTP